MVNSAARGGKRHAAAPARVHATAATAASHHAVATTSHAHPRQPHLHSHVAPTHSRPHQAQREVRIDLSQHLQGQQQQAAAATTSNPPVGILKVPGADGANRDDAPKPRVRLVDVAKRIIRERSNAKQNAANGVPVALEEGVDAAPKPRKRVGLDPKKILELARAEAEAERLAKEAELLANPLPVQLTPEELEQLRIQQEIRRQRMISAYQLSLAIGIRLIIFLAIFIVTLRVVVVFDAFPPVSQDSSEKSSSNHSIGEDLTSEADKAFQTDQEEEGPWTLGVHNLPKYVYWFPAIGVVLICLEFVARIVFARGSLTPVHQPGRKPSVYLLTLYEPTWGCPTLLIYVTFSMFGIALLDLSIYESRARAVYLYPNATVNQFYCYPGLTDPEEKFGGDSHDSQAPFFAGMLATESEWSITLKQLMVLLVIGISYLTDHGSENASFETRLLQSITSGSDIIELSDMLEYVNVGNSLGWCLTVLAIYYMAHVKLTINVHSLLTLVGNRVTHGSKRLMQSGSLLAYIFSPNVLKLIALLLEILMQDAPFLFLRLGFLLAAGTISFTAIFFLLKNCLLLTVAISPIFAALIDYIKSKYGQKHHAEVDAMEEWRKPKFFDFLARHMSSVEQFMHDYIVVHEAAIEDDHAEAEKVFAIHNVDVQTAINKDGMTFLHLASLLGCKEVVKTVLDHSDLDKSDMINAPDSRHWTPLRYAVARDDEGIVNMLMEAKKKLEKKKLKEKEAEEAKKLQEQGAALDAAEKDKAEEEKEKEKEEEEEEEAADDDEDDADPNHKKPKKSSDGRTTLHWACYRGHEGFVERLLEDERVDVNGQDIDGCSPLLLAARWGQAGVVEILLGDSHSRSVDVNRADNKGATSLHWAACLGHVHVAKALINSHSGLNANLRNKNGETALHWAVRWGNDDIIELLVGMKEIDLNVCNSQGLTALELASVMGKEKAAKILLADKRVRLNTAGWTTLHRAAYSGDDEIVEMLLAVSRKLLDVNARSSGWTPLHCSVRKGFANVVKVLLTDKRVDVNLKEDPDGPIDAPDGPLASPIRWTPLHMAARWGYRDVTEALLSSNSLQLNIPDIEGAAPLHRAAEYGQDGVVRALLADARLNINAVDFDGCTALHRASEKCQDVVVKTLLNLGKNLDGNRKDHSQATPLHRAAAKHGNDHVIKSLLDDNRTDVNARDGNGATPLHRAASKGSGHMVKMLLEDKRIDVSNNTIDNEGTTPLYRAVESDQADVVKVLLGERRIDVNARDEKNGWTVLHLAASMGSYGVIKVLLEDDRFDANMRDKEGWSALHRAALEGHGDVVTNLIANPRVNVNATNTQFTVFGRHNFTPLHCAASCNAEKAVRVLLSAKRINPNAEAIYNWTPLHEAALHGAEDAARALLSDRRVKIQTLTTRYEIQGHTAAEIARRRGHKNLSKMIEDSDK